MDLQHFNDFGFMQIKLELPEIVNHLLSEKNYQELDKVMGELVSPSGIIYQELLSFGSIFKTEYLIAIRNGEDDEDGIWHDDGSRDLAFTISLVQDLTQLEGGTLLFRKRANPDNTQRIPTANYGVLTVIKTGKDGYEHRVEKVTRGQRIICAGWVN